MKTLCKRIVKKLIKKKLKISFSESCTGGLLSSNITSVNGASKVFKLGLVVYSNESKTKVLNIPKKINIRSEIEQIRHTKNTYCFFKPCSITNIFCAPIAKIKLSPVKKPNNK